MDEFFDALGDAQVPPTLVVNSGYWQIEVDVTYCEKIALTCRYEIRQIMKMPFGLKKVPGTY